MSHALTEAQARDGEFASLVLHLFGELPKRCVTSIRYKRQQTSNSARLPSCSRLADFQQFQHVFGVINLEAGELDAPNVFVLYVQRDPAYNHH